MTPSFLIPAIDLVQQTMKKLFYSCGPPQDLFNECPAIIILLGSALSIIQAPGRCRWSLVSPHVFLRYRMVLR